MRKRSASSRPAASASSISLGERADVDCHPSLSEIALRIACTRWHTPNCWVTRKIDGIRDQGGRRISYGGRGREHRDSVGDAKREAAAGQPDVARPRTKSRP